MGINPTPTNYKAFTFDGKSTREFGVYITGEGVFNAPERAVEMISIPGRDGDYVLDQGHFNNIEVTYRAGIVSDSTTDFAEAISNFRNWLKSRKGYCRLTDEYNTEEYRMAVFKNAIAVEHEGIQTGEFDVTFDCKPQRYLAIGEEVVEVGAWGNTETEEGDIVTIESDGNMAIKSLTADINPIQDLHGYDSPWVGGGGKNKLQVTASSTTMNGITFTVNTDGTVTANGTATADAYIILADNVAFNGEYTITSGLGIDNSKFIRVFLNGTVVMRTDFGNVPTATLNGSYRFVAYVTNGTTVNNVVFKPMLRLSSVSDSTWTPYSNICPISGWDSVSVDITNNIWRTDFTNSGGGLTKRDGEMDVDISSASATSYLLGGSSDYIGFVLGAGTYTLSAESTDFSGIYVTLADGTTWANGETKTFTSSATINNVRCSQKSLTAGEYTLYWTLLIAEGTDAPIFTTYTTTLPSTTYGGTVDLISGVLTVDKVYLEPTTVTMVSVSSGLYYCRLNLTDYAPSNNVANLISNRFKTVSSAQIGNCYITSAGKLLIFVIPDQTVTNVAQAEQWLANNVTQFVYDLAEPLTYQLTAQQIDFLLGQNNIWADSGDVSVEYGQDPSVLVNPTLFEASPLLAVDGYGTIDFNEYEVEIENVPIGNVLLVGASDFSLENRTQTFTLSQDGYNVGDTITVNVAQMSFDLLVGVTGLSATPYSATATDSQSGFSTIIERGIGYATSARFTGITSGRGVEFTAGTSSTFSNVVSGTVTIQKSGSAGTANVTYTVTETIEYNANTNKIKFYLAHTEQYSDANITGVTLQNRFYWNKISSIIVFSTISAVQDTVYIDCDIGECWTIQGGDIVSLNGVISLGSDLPKLSIGANAFNYDNTITELKVTPRWWKV